MSPRRLLAILLVVATASCAQATSPTPRPTSAPVAPDLAVQYALDALHSDVPTGYLMGMPSVMRGEVLSLAEAYRRVNGTPLADSSPLARYRARNVWLIVTRGEWLLHVPGAHGDPLRGTPTINPKDIVVADLWNAILFDAVSGQIYDRGGIAATQIPQLEQLPELPLPAPLSR